MNENLPDLSVKIDSLQTKIFETIEHRLVEQMIKGTNFDNANGFDNAFEKNLRLLEKLKAGILDETGQLPMNY